MIHEEDIQTAAELVKNPIWLAGFFDGEGCISASVSESNTCRFQIRVTFTQKCQRLLALLMLNYGGTVEGMHLFWCGKQCKPILEMMLPYLVVKKRQAQVALELLNTIGSDSSNLQATIKAKRLVLVQKLKDAKAV